MSYAIAAIVLLVAVAGGRVLFASVRGELVAPDEAKVLVDEGALLVDVRTPQEFSAGHIEGAKNIPVGTVEDNLEAFGPKAAPIVLYCRSGARSGRAKSTLQQHGFTEVHNLGGMNRW